MTYSFSSSYDKSWNFDWKGIRPNVKDSILKIKRFGRLITSIGERRDYYKQIKTQSWLVKNTKTAEFVSLTNFPDANIKALAYNVLLRKKDIDKYYFIKKSFNDSLSFVKLAGGCLIYDMHLVEYLLKHQLNFRLKRPKGFPKIEDELSLKQILEIDSLYNKLKNRENYYKGLVYKTEVPLTNYNWH